MKHVTHWINGAPYVAPEAVAQPDRVGAALSALRDSVSSAFSTTTRTVALMPRNTACAQTWSRSTSAAS